MTAQAIEVEQLDLGKDTPPCEATSDAWYGPCGRPSVVRIKSWCPCLGKTVTYEFMCDRCYALVRSGNYRCGFCLAEGVVDWSLA